MSIFKRLKDLTLANIYPLIDKVEDPIKVTDQYLRKMQEDLDYVENGIASQITLEKKFQRLYEEQQDLFNKYNEQAHIAAQARNAELTRRALEAKLLVQQKMTEYKESYERNQELANQLREKLNDMRNHYMELKNQREMLVARANAAKARQNIHTTVSDFTVASQSMDIRRMEEKVLDMELEAQASEDWQSKGKSLDEKYQRLSHTQAIEKELDELMKKYEA